MRGFSHPRNLHRPYLTTVLWAVFDRDERRDVRDDGCNTCLVDDEANEARLKHLGYMSE